MAKKPSTGRSREDQKRAREIADRYFEFGRGEGESDEEKRRKHLDEGFEDGAPKVPGAGTSGTVPPTKPERLTLKQSMFIAEYLKDFNGTQAAIRAGYSDKTAPQIAYENLNKPHVRAIIDRELNERAAKAKWDANMLLVRLGQEVTADIADLFDEKGNLKPVQLWPMVFRTGLVAGIDLEETTQLDAAGEAIPGVVRKIKLSDRLKRLELLGKHIGVMAFKERQLTPEDEPPLQRLLREMQGTSIRPTTIDGTARQVEIVEGDDETPVQTPAPAVKEPPAPATAAPAVKAAPLSKKLTSFGSLRPREA